MYYEEQTAEAKKRAEYFIANRIPKFLGYFEGILKRNPKGADSVLGKKVSYVDLSLFQMIEGLRYAFPRTMTKLEPQSPRLIIARSRHGPPANRRLFVFAPAITVQPAGHFSPISRVGRLE